MSRQIAEGYISVPFHFSFDFDPDNLDGFTTAEDRALWELEQRMEALFDGDTQEYDIDQLAVL